MNNGKMILKQGREDNYELLFLQRRIGAIHNRIR